MPTPPMTDRAQLTIGALARAAEISVDTVRFYERKGLLPAPSRTSGDHRRYSSDTPDRLTFIRVGQRLGLRLEEIKELLDACDDTVGCPLDRSRQVLRQRLADVDTQIDQLADLRGRLQLAINRLGLHGDDLDALLSDRPATIEGHHR